MPKSPKIPLPQRARAAARRKDPTSGRTTPKGRATPSRTSPWAAALISITFLIFICSLAAARRLPWIAPVVYLVVSAVTIIVYALDKNAAMNGRWRTRESTLHLLALAGGWPGAWVAQFWFRHKTRKGSFIVAFWLSVTLNLAALWTVIELDGPLAALPWKIERS